MGVFDNEESDSQQQSTQLYSATESSDQFQSTSVSDDPNLSELNSSKSSADNSQLTEASETIIHCVINIMVSSSKYLNDERVPDTRGVDDSSDNVHAVSGQATEEEAFLGATGKLHMLLSGPGENVMIFL